MTFQEMIVAIRDCLCDVVSSDNREDGEDEDDKEIEWGQQSDDD
jgi:hypothetical protein